MNWISLNKFAIGWYPSPDLIWSLIVFNCIPGLAGFFALALARQGFRKQFALTTPIAWQYIPLALFIFPVFAVIAAAFSVLVHQANWDWHLLELTNDFFLRFSDQQNAMYYFEHSFSTPVIWLIMLLVIPLIYLLPSWIEELGWRGYLYHHLRPKGFWFTIVITALLWWLMRLPLTIKGHYYPDHHFRGILVSLGFALTFHCILTWLRDHSKGTLIPALARATFYGAATFPLSLTKDYIKSIAHLEGLIGIITLSLFIGIGWWAGWFRPATLSKS